MNVLFLTLLNFESIYERNIYTDLLREFIRHGHRVYAISPVERRMKQRTHVVREGKSTILRLRIENTQKTNRIEKGISTVMMEALYIQAVRKYFYDVTFELVLYATPPITLCGAVEYVKKRDGARTYLLLKDIFPQNAVDIGMMRKDGIKGILYRYFREKEKRLYRISDTIGCMSEANVEYVRKHNPDVEQRNNVAINQWKREIVEVCPNSIEPVTLNISPGDRKELRRKYSIPENKIVFVYGGNLGKPQGIPFMLKCLHSQKKNNKVFFLIVGSGTEYETIENYIEKYKPTNIALHKILPKDDYDRLIAACDVGMIFLDHRFTIPNFPSRLLSYMQARLPVLAVTDTSTDIGKVIKENGFGWWCESNDVSNFINIIKRIIYDKDSGWENYGERGFEYLVKEYNVKGTFEKIYS